MKIPFTTEQFLGVFAAYNQSVWPAQVALFAAALVILALSLKTFSFSSIVSGSILGVFWIWMGIAYHIVQFTSINPAAYVFGIACILQGLIFLWNGFRRTLEFRFSWDVSGMGRRSLDSLCAHSLSDRGLSSRARLSILAHVWFALPHDHLHFRNAPLGTKAASDCPDHSRTLVCRRIFCSAATWN